MSVKCGAPTLRRCAGLLATSALLTGFQSIVLGQVSLLPTATPSAAEAGLTLVSVTGSEFPAGTIIPSQVTVTLAPASPGTGDPVAVEAYSVTTVIATTRKVTFLLPASIHVGSPTVYSISIASSTSPVFTSNQAVVTVNPSASIASILPGSGAPGSTVSVQIQGSYSNFFSGASTVTAGSGISVSDVNVISPTLLQAQFAIAPTASPGSYTVSVTTGGSVTPPIPPEVASLVNGFTITGGAEPIITNVNPSAAQQGASSIPVTITGSFTHFNSASVVTFANGGVTAGTPTAATLTSLTVPVSITATASLGATNVTVTTGAEVVTLANGFAVTAGTPVITQINPNSAQQGAASVPVTITGNFTHFSASSAVSFANGAVTAGAPTAATLTSLTVPVSISAGASVGATNVTVTTGSEIVSLANGFTVNAGTPAITQVKPNSGQQGASGVPVTITGNFTHFSTASVVTFGNGSVTAGAPTAVTLTSLTVPVSITPAATLGATSVTVTTGSEVATLTNGFTIYAGTPLLLSVLPNTGSQGQKALSVAVTGQFTHFAQGVSAVSLGSDITVNSVTVANATSLTVSLTIPATANLGGHTVTVATGSEVATLVNGFTVSSASLTVNAGPNQSAELPILGLPQAYTLTLLPGLPGGTGSAAQDINDLGEVAGYAANAAGAYQPVIWRSGNPVSIPTLGGAAGGFLSININGQAAGQSQDAGGNWNNFYFDGVGLTNIAPAPHGCCFWEMGLNQSGLTVGMVQPFNAFSYQGGELTSLPVLSGTSVSQPLHVNDAGLIVGRDSDASGYYPVTWTNGEISVLPGLPGLPNGYAYSVNSFGDIAGLVTDPSGVADIEAVIWRNGSVIPLAGLTGANAINTSRQVLAGAGGQGFVWQDNVEIGLSPFISCPAYGLTAMNNMGQIAGYCGVNGTDPSIQAFVLNPNPGDISPPQTTVSLAGSVSDGDPPSSGPLTLQWTQVSGPGTVVFANANQAVASATFTQVGSYVLRLTAKDALNTSSGDTTVVVTNGNQPPSVYAGPGQTITLPAGALLSATVSDDGLPVGSSVTVNWRMITGPGPVVFSAPTSASTMATFATPGAYLLRIVASDSVLTSASDISIVVLPAGPSITLNPNSGQQGQQNLSVSITGASTNWVQGTTQANFGSGITVASLTVNTATSATAVINISPTAALGAYNVTLTTGAEIETLPSGFSVVSSSSVPTITTVSPSSGPQGQGGPVAIVGQNTHFVQGTTQVNFGPGITVTSVSVTCPTCLTAQILISSTAAVGPVTVTVTTGSEVASLANGFTILAGTPILTSLAPDGGQQGQTLGVAITGQYTHFAQGTTQVSFGAGITVSNVTVLSATSLTAQLAIAANATVGTYTLVVTTGSEVVSVPNVFSVVAATPIVLSLAPGGGQQGQTNLPVLITGVSTHWVQGTTAASFGPGITVTGLAVTTATTAIATVNIDPAAAIGPRTVTLTTNAEIASFTNGFTVSAAMPIVLSLDPGGAQQGQQNLSVTVTGLNTHWSAGTSQASFGAGVTVVSFTVTSLTAATAVVNIDPAAALGARTVTVTTGTEVASFASGFTIIAGTPVITQVNPSTGAPGQSNLSVTVTAQFTHFAQGTTTASFGPGVTVASLTVNSTTSATATLNIDPAAALGARTVSMTTGTEIAALANGFTIGAAATPTLTQLNPNNGQQAQQNLAVTITGQATHFAQGTTQVSFGGPGITVDSVTVASATSLTAVISIAASTATGPRTVTATTGTEVAALANGFMVNTGTNQAPVITIAPTWSDVLPSRLTITYTVTDDGLPAGGALTVSWQIISTPPGATAGFESQTLTSISVGFDTAGTYVLQISASDSQLTTTQNVTVTVSGTALPPPNVSIATPADGASVTTQISVTGTVASPELASWTLEYEVPGGTVFQTLATGTAPVTNGILGTFDPTLLINGIAFIQLQATDTSGQTSTAGPISVVVTKNQKIGNFTVSFIDLTVPTAGLPLQITRTYDSRNKLIGDFGVGWTLGISNVQAAESQVTGAAWTGTSSGGAFPTYCVQPAAAHVITVTLPDGTTYAFDVSLTPQCQALVPPDQVTIGFTPEPGTVATLNVMGGNQATVEGAFPGPVQLYDLNTGMLIDASQLVLTLPDGRALTMGLGTGLQSIKDLNGNTITITLAGIQHSDGKSVVFQRDVYERITQITDPSGNVLHYAYDLNGNLSTFTDPASNITTFTYDSNHGLLNIEDPLGIQPIRNIYDSSGRLIQTIDAFGKVITYNNSIGTSQEIVTDRLGNQTVNAYDADGNIVQVTNALGGVTNRTYDSNDNLLTETNPLGETRTYTYDAQNNRLSETDPLGHTTTYTYNGHAQVLTTTDPLGHVTTNTYDANGNLLSTQDAAGNTTTYTYNSSGLRTSMTDPLSDVTTYQYDAFGNLMQQNDALGHITTYTYDANGNRLSQTQTRTTVSGLQTLLTSYQFDGLNRLTQTTYPDGSTTQIQYNAIGKQSVTIDQLGHQTSYTYDAMGRLTQTTYPDGTNEGVGYDAENDRTSSTDRDGRTTTYAYDPLKRLTTTTYADGATAQTGYDAASEVTQVTDARGNITQYAYDQAGRRTGVTDALSHMTGFAYDAAGNQLSMTDANGNTTQYQYDPLNRRTRVTYPDATFDSTVYDALGRTTSKTDEAGLTTQFQYDKLGRLTQVTDALSQLTSYAYDEVGNRISQTDANSHTTAFAYDPLGRRTKRTLPLGMSETMTYDAAGNLKTKIDFNGKTTTYNYDVVNRLTSKAPDVSFGAPSIGFTYTATGQRQMMMDASGTTSYTYDLRDRLTQKVTPEGTLTYTYDLAGNLLSIGSSNTGGTSVNYTFDALNRLSTANNNALASGTTTYAYDNVGNLLNYLYPNGVQTTYAYNTLNRLAGVTLATGSTLASYAYTLGPAGNRTQVTEFGGRQVNYAYDALYRLKTETIAGGSVNGAIGYQYDAVGNRLQRTSTVTPVPPATSSYDANDRLTTDSYDQDGNTIADGGNTFTYDFENHLQTENGGAVTIVYDGDGNRVSKTAGGVTTKYLVDDRNLTGYAQVLEEISSGTVQRVYTFGLNRISQSQGSGTSFYGYDGHGSVRLLMDSTGAITDRYDYDAFGNLINQTGSTPNLYQYSGEQNDPNLAFYYLRARYLSQSTGRFWTMDSDDVNEQDPEQPITLHKYLYADANPSNVIDPSGHQGIDDIGLASLVVDIIDIFSTIEEPRGGSVIDSSKASITSCQVNLDTFASTLTGNTSGATVSGHNCSHAVYVALQAGGANFDGYLWPPAKDFGSRMTLPGVGFTELSPTPVPGYSPEKGDVAVFQSLPPGTGTKGSANGHVEGYNGSIWVSDYLQMNNWNGRDNGFWPGRVWRDAGVSYAIYRCQR